MFKLSVDLWVIEIFDGANEARRIIGSSFDGIAAPDSICTLAKSGVYLDGVGAFIVGGLIGGKRDEVIEEIIEDFAQLEVRIITDISLD